MDKKYESVSSFASDVTMGDQIALVSSSFNGKGGDCRVIQQQARELASSGYDVTIIALEATIEPPEGVDLEVVGRPQNGIPGRLYRLAYPVTPSALGLVRKLRSYDVAIAHRYPATVSCYLALMFGTVTYVYWFHHIVDSDKFEGLARVWIKMLAYLESQHRAVVEADYICAVSELSKSVIDEAAGCDAIVVPNSIDVERFDTKKSADWVNDNYGIPSDRDVVLFVGRLTPQKNVHELLKMSSEIDAHFVISGSLSDGKYVEKLQRLAGDNVTFTGYVSDEELGALYERADVFATCSISEGWSLTPAEASHFSTDVVAFENNESARAVDAEHLVSVGDYEGFRNALTVAIGQ